MQTRVISRIAPTPSGYLHLGNAYNFILTWWLVRQKQGILHLRLDDSDRARVRDEYIQDIFDTLAWLGLDWDKGPRNGLEFQAKFSQTLKTEKYYELLKKIPGTYVCRCSRKDFKDFAPDPHRLRCPGNCRAKNLQFEPEKNCIRILTDEKDWATQDSGLFDFVVWRKDDTPAYHLASLSDDMEMQTTFIIRGTDLMPSTRAQIFLAEKLKAQSFIQTKFYHHELIKDQNLRKLSKSQNGNEHPLELRHLRQAGLEPADILTMLAPYLGHKVKDLSQLLKLPHPFNDCL